MVLRLGSGKCRKEREAFDSGSDAFGRRKLDFWELYLDDFLHSMSSDIDDYCTCGESWGTASAGPRVYWSSRKEQSNDEKPLHYS